MPFTRSRGCTAAQSGSCLHAVQSGDEWGQGVGGQDLSLQRAGGTVLPLSLQLTVQFTMSSPGAPPPPLSPEGATEGAVRAKGHRCGW